MTRTKRSRSTAKAKSNVQPATPLICRKRSREDWPRVHSCFRGRVTAVDSLDQTLADASRKHLKEAAERVFERYQEAAERVETALAEKLLRITSLRAVTSQIDPLGLVQVSGGTPSIRTDHKALVSIKDFLERNGTVEGKRILDPLLRSPIWLVARHGPLHSGSAADRRRDQAQGFRP